MTDELDDVDASGTTLQPPIAELGVEAQAEYQRLRSRLGLRKDDEEPGAGLPSLGRYRLERELGRGGMGVVYLAQDPEVGRPVAIKLVRGLPFAATTKLRARLLREAKVLGKLTHPNVVRIYDVGSHEGEVYLAMEYVDGQTLHEWQQGRERDEIVDAYVQAARGLAAAHDVGIVHRDFKPDNVFVARDGRILVGDFGLAGAVVPDHETEPSAVGSGPEGGPPSIATKTGALLGTPAYMAPEQLRGDVATPSSDQFALCVSLWEAITTRRPFEGEDAPRLLEAIERGVPASAERIPKKLHRVLRRGLAANPDERYEDIRALCDALERLRSRPTVMIGALALVGVALGTWVLATSQAPQEETCELEQAVANLENDQAWPTVRQEFAEAGISDALADLEVQLVRLEESMAELCEQPRTERVLARMQHLHQWTTRVESLLKTAGDRTPRELLDEVQYLLHERLSAPPPRPLREPVVDAIQESWEYERSGDLDTALARANHAVVSAGESKLDLALALKRRGRVRTLMGDHAGAMDDYTLAISHADAAGYDDARFETLILAARTAIGRLEDLEQGAQDVTFLAGLIDRLEEPTISPRRADYHELQGSLLNRQGHYLQALGSHWLALGQRLWLWSSAYAIGRSLINLAVVHEYQSMARQEGSDGHHHDLARLHYELALIVLAPAVGAKASPEWLQAAYNLGRGLTQSDDPAELQRARELLDQVRDESNDHYALATTELLNLAVHTGESSKARELATELREHLEKEPPSSASRAFDHWQVLALEAAHSGRWAELDEAVTRAYREAERVEASGSQSLELLEERRLGFEIGLAVELEDVDLARAASFARRAKERIESLPKTNATLSMLPMLNDILAREPS